MILVLIVRLSVFQFTDNNHEDKQQDDKAKIDTGTFYFIAIPEYGK